MSFFSRKQLLPFLALLLAPLAISCSRARTEPLRALAPRESVQSPPATDAAKAPEPTGPLQVGVHDAILLALENNHGLVVERFSPAISRTFIDQEKAVFDPVVAGQVSGGQTRAERATTSGMDSSTSSTASGSISLEKATPAGTRFGVEGSRTFSDSSLYGDQFLTSRIGLSLSQALLKGAGSRSNLARVEQARIDAISSEYELRGFTEDLVARVEETYWDYALAKRQIEIFDESLKLAEKQLDETQDRINIGQLAETELAAAQAEVALRQEALINARSSLATIRLRLLRLLNPPGPDLWEREVVVETQPAVPDAALEDAAAHVDVALQMRPDLNQARLSVQRGDLELIRTKNGLLPRMDLFITLGRTGYSDSFGGWAFGGDSHGYDAMAGLRLEFPVGNRAARAAYDRAGLSRDRATEAVRNLEQLVQVDVRAAHIEVNRAKEQVAATAATRAYQEEKLRAETEKFKVGKSTSLFVAQAQRDLVAAQIAEIQAVVSYLKSFIQLYRLEGSLLDRRGIAAPGREPVDWP
ncbi:MAG TPA: TolC family protein [Planctomycetota bacterium]|nr:TolC family protein [Planctomycetota bacterium]